MPLTADKQRALIRDIGIWRRDPERHCACPVCGNDRLEIIDRSARPYAEWYAISCEACDFAETLHIPLGPSVQTLD